MVKSEYSGLVKAPLAIVWQELVEKVRRPDKFLKGVTNPQILEEGPGDRVIRRMTVNLPGKPEINLVEEIVWSEAELYVDFRIIEHPSHTGNVINKIEKHDDGTLWLTFIMDWKFKGEGPDPMEGLHVKGGVESTIQHIESVAN